MKNVISIKIPNMKIIFSHSIFEFIIFVFERIIRKAVGASIVTKFEHVEPTKLHIVSSSSANKATASTNEYKKNIIVYFPHLVSSIVSPLVLVTL